MFFCCSTIGNWHSRGEDPRHQEHLWNSIIQQLLLMYWVFSPWMSVSSPLKILHIFLYIYIDYILVYVSVYQINIHAYQYVIYYILYLIYYILYIIYYILYIIYSILYIIYHILYVIYYIHSLMDISVYIDVAHMYI